MRFYLSILAVAFVAFAGASSFISTSQLGATQAPAPEPVELTIVQQVAADKAEAAFKTGIEAANIEGAFNRALHSVGSQTQAYQAISGAKWQCFDTKMFDKLYPDMTRDEIAIHCAHREAKEHPAIEIYVFGQMP